MSVIAQRVWREPAVAVGLLVTIALFVLNLAADEAWDAATVITVLGPLLSALGIRQAVSPAAGPRPPEEEGTTYQPPPPPG